MDIDTRLQRGDRIRMRPDPDWPNDPPEPIWEVLCEPYLAPEGHWNLHIRYVTAGTCDNSAVGDTDFMGVRMDQIDYIARADSPDRSCDGEHYV